MLKENVKVEEVGTVGRWILKFQAGCIVFLFGVLSSAVGGWVLASAWNWFIVGVLTSVRLTVFQAIMVAFVVRSFAQPLSSLSDLLAKKRLDVVFKKVTGEEIPSVTTGLRLTDVFGRIMIYLVLYGLLFVIHKFY